MGLLRLEPQSEAPKGYSIAAISMEWYSRFVSFAFTSFT
jgi:hypothetical protein